MTEAMTDDRLNSIEQISRMTAGMDSSVVLECAGEIRRLREDNAEQRAINDQDYKSIQTLRGEIKNLRQELVKLHGVVDLALDCWGPIDKRPRTDFVLRTKAFMKALRELDEEET
jgi:hypothetical protein